MSAIHVGYDATIFALSGMMATPILRYTDYATLRYDLIRCTKLHAILPRYVFRVHMLPLRYHYLLKMHYAAYCRRIRHWYIMPLITTLPLPRHTWYLLRHFGALFRHELPMLLPIRLAAADIFAREHTPPLRYRYTATEPLRSSPLYCYATPFRYFRLSILLSLLTLLFLYYAMPCYLPLRYTIHALHTYIHCYAIIAYADIHITILFQISITTYT